MHFEKTQQVPNTYEHQKPSPIETTPILSVRSEQKSRILLDTSFSDEHMKGNNYDRVLEKSMNDYSKVIEVLEKTEDVKMQILRYNVTINEIELNPVVETVIRMNCLSHDDYIHQNMIATSVPILGTCLINFFIRCGNSARWPWNETQYFPDPWKPLDPNYSEPSEYKFITRSSLSRNITAIG